MNVKKTNAMQFISPRGTRTMSSNMIEVGEHRIEFLSKSKFLGVIIDEKLTFSDHIEHVRNKMSSGIAALARCRNLLPKALKQNIYFAFVHSHMSYCLPLYGLNYFNKISPIHMLQKRALRLVNSLGYLDSVRPIYKRDDILPFPLLIK